MVEKSGRWHVDDSGLCPTEAVLPVPAMSHSASLPSGGLIDRWTAPVVIRLSTARQRPLISGSEMRKFERLREGWQAKSPPPTRSPVRVTLASLAPCRHQRPHHLASRQSPTCSCASICLGSLISCRFRQILLWRTSFERSEPCAIPRNALNLVFGSVT